MGDGNEEPPPKPSPEELLRIVTERLEDLLSKQNLAEDAFIQQNVNAQMYIPICILACHQYLSGLGADISVLLEAARKSEKLAVDEDGLMVRPLFKTKRNTLILRELHEEVTEEELQKLFAGSPESNNIVSIKPDINQTAFVTFKTDEATQNVALWLRSQKLRGQSVRCAIKSEHLLRSFFPAGPAGVASPQQYPMPWVQWMDPSGMQWQGDEGGYAGHDGDYGGAWDGQAGDGGYDGEGKGRKGDRKGKGKGKRRSKGNSGVDPEGESVTPLATPMRSPMMTTVASPGQSVFKAEYGSEPRGSIAEEPILEEGDAEEPKYNHAYRSYTREKIIEVCNAMEEIAKPESYAKFETEEKDAIFFRQVPCKDWAPVPTPAMSYFDKRGKDDDGEGGGGAARRRSRSRTNQERWSRTSTGSGQDFEAGGEDWGADGWGSGSARWRKKSRDRTSWEDGSYGKGKGGERWTERSQDTPKMTWAEKIKKAAEGHGAVPQKWVVKKEKKDAAAPGQPEEGAKPGGGETKADTAGESGDKGAGQEQSGGDAGSPKPAQSWADKVRASASS